MGFVEDASEVEIKQNMAGIMISVITKTARDGFLLSTNISGPPL
jgi:hypothetical protein